MIQNRSKTTFTSSVSEVYNIIFFSKIFPLTQKMKLPAYMQRKLNKRKDID